MLDDFREQADASTFFDDLEEEETTTRRGASPLSRYIFLGMTPSQRFVIALLLLITACLFSALCLLVTGKVVPLP